MTISTRLITLAGQFRLGLALDAALELPPLMKSLVPLLPALPPATQQQLPQIMSAILACQEREDWLGLADWLEYELLHLLSDQV
ncbi:hypothetical protein M976_01936 [Buttiauxella ferragutiae ATCC 51602]|uniref:Uncharacterized protein n=1 Tax=Buttiauxella ferragutiae ATCC 51602 TaxID=1354252 RepID=A0ABX2W997_9ENTR|nr:hypothetical protein [Buttiauxella ferragutiae]OAT28097.1 hypothetical protein M976_01936 [Buttiauxella ferragutiae ATCC 51602]